MQDPSSNNATWHHWFQLYGPKLLLCARQWTARASDAEDIVQEAFVRYWRHQRALDSEALPLLLLSIRRSAFDLGRRASRRAAREDRSATDQPADEPPFFEATFAVEERTQAVEGALRSLPADQREVVVLKIWGELTFDQIARQLAIPANTAASRYRYGLIGLRKALASLGQPS